MVDYVTIHKPAKNRAIAAFRDWRLGACLKVTNWQHWWKPTGVEMGGDPRLTAPCYLFYRCRFCGTAMGREVFGMPKAGGRGPTWASSMEWTARCAGGEEWFTQDHIAKTGTIFDWAAEEYGL